MYEFEAVHDVIPEEERLALSELFAHELMGEIALEWAELIRAAIRDGHEIVVFKIYKKRDFIGVAMISIVRKLDWTKYLWKPAMPFFKLLGMFDVGFLEIPFSNMAGLLTVEGIDRLERGNIINDLCGYIQKSLHLGILCVKIDNSVEMPGDSSYCKNMVLLSFYPNTLLDYPFNSLDEFLNALPRKKFRKCRADMRALKKYGGSVEICHDISPLVSHLYRLYKKTSEVVKKKPHYMEMPVLINREFYAALPLFSHLNPSVALVRVDGVIVAYSLLFQSGNTIFFKAVGLDYDMSYKTKAYFNLYYATLEYASRQNCDKVDFGVTSYHFKKWIGCELYPATYLIGSSHPLFPLLKKPAAFFVESKIGTRGSGPA